ncbi:MAG TPA: ATP-binding protein [Solirubrobacteraceae bacterium]
MLTRTLTRMRSRKPIVALIAATVGVLALLSVFATELSNTQAKSRQDVISRVHERAVLAAALIDSLFQSVQQQVPQDAAKYGGRVVPSSLLDVQAQGSDYLALLDQSGKVIASSRGFNAEARADLPHSAALALVRAGHPYGVGNVLPYGRSGVVNLATPFPTRYGTRTLLTGIPPQTLSLLLGGELRKITGVPDAHNYLLDARDTVLASTNPAIPAGYRFTSPSQVGALSHSSGDRNGRYYEQTPLVNSSWRIVLAAPDGPLFASVSGFRKWLPWLIFAAFALVALVALVLGRRVLQSAESSLSHAKTRLESVNRELADSNEELERRAAELARSNAELEQFASIASHDLQEPLRKIRTFTEQITSRESDRLSERGRDYLNRTNNAAERMQALIQGLLQFSRVTTQARPFGLVDLQRVMEETLDDLSTQIERTAATVHVGLLPAIHADGLQMRQLFQNLISNAIKFHRDGVAPEVSVRAQISGGELLLTVQDNGIGFETQYSGRIFRVFERLHGRSEYPGTGIGLALCRKIAERHGGTIVAEGDLGAGATFTVVLPVGTAAMARSPEPATNGRPTDQERAHVTT